MFYGKNYKTAANNIPVILKCDRAVSMTDHESGPDSESLYVVIERPEYVSR